MPDKLDDDDKPRDATTAVEIFTVTTVAFFLAEIGDKTQIATAALAARYATIVPVVLGTTLGMLAADVPAVLFGRLASERVRGAWARYGAAALFIVLGLVTILALD